MKFIGGQPVHECKWRKCTKRRGQSERYCLFHQEIARNVKEIEEVFPG